MSHQVEDSYSSFTSSSSRTTSAAEQLQDFAHDKDNDNSLVPLSSFVAVSSLSHIPANQRIRVLYADSDVVVIVKPCNLRSVPGFAAVAGDSDVEEEDDDEHGVQDLQPQANATVIPGTSAFATSSRSTRQRGMRRTAQEAWVLALQSFQNEKKMHEKEEEDDVVSPSASGSVILSFLSQLASQDASHLASIPRKYKLFRRYLERNSKRLNLSHIHTFLKKKKKDSAITTTTSATKEEDGDSSLAVEAFLLLQKRQGDYLNLPQATAPEESALGQLSLLLCGGDGGGKNSSCIMLIPRIHVVHRLDCETSGIMVFARTCRAAQVLSRAWREHLVTKIYHALVHDWPLSSTTTTAAPTCSSGRIDLALKPSTSERIKWQVVDDNDEEEQRRGKPSTTLWKVLRIEEHHHDEDNQDDHDKDSHNDHDTTRKIVRLELVPLTGRTHQLRIHCAAVGGGILGDSLYGVSSQTRKTIKTLKLHAYKLCFPHPKDSRPMEFVVDPEW